MKNKILVIDDDQAICIFLSVVLSKSFYVSTAHDGMGAMYLLSEGNIPDLIITDLEMPNLSGIELIENLKKSRLYRNIPIIVLSGYDSTLKEAECLNLGVCKYIKKQL